MGWLVGLCRVGGTLPPECMVVGMPQLAPACAWRRWESGTARPGHLLVDEGRLPQEGSSVEPSDLPLGGSDEAVGTDLAARSKALRLGTVAGDAPGRRGIRRACLHAGGMSPLEVV